MQTGSIAVYLPLHDGRVVEVSADLLSAIPAGVARAKPVPVASSR